MTTLKGEGWDQHLDFIVTACNATPHESTGLTPHRLVYGIEMTFPLDIITDPIGMKKDDGKLMSEYVIVLENNLKEAHETARKKFKRSSEKAENDI